MNRYLASYDLHLHSYYSYDACTAPEYYFAQAMKLGLRAIAITDHHNWDVLPVLKQCATKFPEVGYFTGAELTCTTPYGKMDFVCFGLPWEPTPELKALGDTLHRYQIEQGEAFAKIAAKLGGNYDTEVRKKLLLRYRPAEIIAQQGVTHVRGEMQFEYWIEHGIIRDMDDLNRALWDEATNYHTLLPTLPGADEVSRIVHQAGGIVLIAHPTGYFQGKNLKRMDALREFANFDGIECAHPSTAPENGIFWREYCEKHHLLSSGGTDTHSDAARAYLKLSEGSVFGEHLGADYWLDELCERIPLYHGGGC